MVCQTEEQLRKEYGHGHECKHLEMSNDWHNIIESGSRIESGGT